MLIGATAVDPYANNPPIATPSVTAIHAFTGLNMFNAS
jgi:hypothetical protein